MYCFQTNTTLDEKYEDEGYRNLMKNFAASAASGDLAGLEKGLTEVVDRPTELVCIWSSYNE